MNEYPNITADSTPDLDTWGWDSFWSCSQWQEWHNKMLQAYGTEEANSRFLYYWNEQTFGAHALDCRSFNTTFRDYFREQGILGQLYDGEAILQPIGGVVDAGNTLGGISTNLQAGLLNISLLLKYVLPIAAAALIVGGGYFLYKQYLKK